MVDTCVLIDILENDPSWGKYSARCLKQHLSHGLVICPVSMIELAPAFEGNIQDQRDFLALCGVDDTFSFSDRAVQAAYQAWDHYIRAKRGPKSAPLPKRPIADIMIGGFAVQFEGLITRNPSDFSPWFPRLSIVDPGTNR